MSEKKVKADELVEVTGTGKGKFLAKGKKKMVHKIVAEKLVTSGLATMGEAVQSGKSTQGKKDKLDM